MRIFSSTLHRTAFPRAKSKSPRCNKEYRDGKDVALNFPIIPFKDPQEFPKAFRLYPPIVSARIIIYNDIFRTVLHFKVLYTLGFPVIQSCRNYICSSTTAKNGGSLRLATQLNTRTVRKKIQKITDLILNETRYLHPRIVGRIHLTSK